MDAPIFADTGVRRRVPRALVPLLADGVLPAK
jgi:hypothetical protein